MLLRRFYEEGLAQASYLIGCQKTGEAIVVDPHRDAALYMAAAEDEDVRITRVTETHIHADYASGARELAHRTGATLMLSDEGGRAWRYGYAAGAGAVLLEDGDVVRLGHVRLQVLHTPGHTPEHLSFLVTDGAASEEPMGLLSGDFLFVGDVGRPDLLESAAGVAGAMEEGARQLFDSLARIRRLPDHLQIWPGHGAGSACGKALGAVPGSTLGYERLVSWAFQYQEVDAFVEAVLEDQPEPPTYFAVMKTLNRDGPPVLGRLPEPGRLGPDRLSAVLADDGVVVDVRAAEAFSAAHRSGTLSIPLTRSFSNWAGWLLPYDRPLHLVAEDEDQARVAARALVLVGLDRVEGWFGPDALRHDGRPEEAPGVEPEEARRMQEEEGALLVDVRSAVEFREGHAPGARHLHLGHLAQGLRDLPPDAPLVLVCRTGHRSGIGQSLALARGRPAVNVLGGMEAWTGQGLPTES